MSILNEIDSLSLNYGTRQGAVYFPVVISKERLRMTKAETELYCAMASAFSPWVDNLVEPNDFVLPKKPRRVCPGCLEDIDIDWCVCGGLVSEKLRLAQSDEYRSKSHFDLYPFHRTPFVPFGCKCYIAAARSNWNPNRVMNGVC